MVFGAPDALTKVSFRRDVKLFLAVLFGFFTLLMVLLLGILQNTLRTVEQATAARDAELAEAATAAVREVIAGGGDLDTELVLLRSRYGFAAIEVKFDENSIRRTGFPGPGLRPTQRRLPRGTVTFFFDDSLLAGMRQRFYLTTLVGVMAAAAGAVLLFLYVPHILRPVEKMLDHARQLGDADRTEDEASYLIETFRRSLATLKTQEAELKRLHDLEKTRADDLQTITSTLTRSLGSGLIVFGADDAIADVNSAAREILDLGREQPVAGLKPRQLFGDNPFAQRLEEAVVRREALSRLELELPVPHGAKVIGLTSVPLFNVNDRFLGTLALFADLTQIRRLESRVRELQTLADLGVVSAGIAHEFRNALSTILGLLKLAQRTPVPPEVGSKLNAAEAEARQLADAVTRLLQFARPMKLEVENVALGALIESLAQRLRETSSGVDLIIRGEANVAGDATLLARAFENVIRNAIEAVQENGGGQVVVTISGGSETAVEVQDSGPGIGEEATANLFLPFHSTKPAGVGLGLPLARKIILLHGGTISIRSRPGGGTIVRVEFLEVHAAERARASA